MFKYKGISLLIFTVFMAGCKIKQEIPQNKPLLAMANKYTALSDSAQVTLPSIQTFFADSTLISLIDTALHNNFDMQITLQRIEMARAGVRFTKGLGLPELSANVAAGGRKFGKYTVDGVGNYDTQFSTNIDDKQQIPSPFIPDYLVGVQSAWEVDLWGKLKSQKKAALSRFLSAGFGRNLVETALIAEVANAYFELLVLDNELMFLEENIKLQQSSLDMVRILKQAGEANQLGVELLKAQLLSSSALKIEVNQQIILNESKINFLLGRYPQPIKRPVFAWENVIPPTLSAGIPSALLQNRPDIKQAELELLASNADLYTAKAAFYPSLNITGTLGLQAFKALLLVNPASAAYGITGGLVAPLANRRQLAAGLMSAKAEQQIAYTNYQKSIVNGFTEVYNYMNLIRTNAEIYKLKSEEVASLRNSIGISSELFKSGRATYLEVITAQKNALQAQIELINIKKQQYSVAIGLYKSLGGGWKNN
jgi:NodT family efflux transporter outer membrane factor (OMF) lipoprotein